MKNSGAIVTCNFGNYDLPKECKVFDGWDAYYFTDKEIELEGWNVVIIKDINSVKISRKVKILTHRYLPKYHWFCYIDGNMQLTKSPIKKNTRVLHPTRKSVIEEAQHLFRLYKIDCMDQVEKYLQQGMKNETLLANGFFIRNTKQDYLHEFWWKEYIKGNTLRDQISLPFVFWKHKIHQHTINWITMHQHIKYFQHVTSGTN